MQDRVRRARIWYAEEHDIGRFRQTDFDQVLGKPAGTTAHWESGQSLPSARDFRLISQRTGISLEWLMEGLDEQEGAA